MSAIYDSSYLGTPNNIINFNDYSRYPVFRVKNILPARFQVREQNVPLPALTGVADYAAYLGKTVFVIAGTMYVNTEDQYYRGREQLRNIGSMDISQNDPYSDGGYVPYVWYEAGRGRQLFVKVEYADDLGEATGKGFIQPFRLVCTIKQPKIYGLSVVTTTLNAPPNAANLGGARIAATIPMQIGAGVATNGTTLSFTLPVVLGANPYSTGGIVRNEGSLASYPTTIIYGPLSKPRVTNLTTGEYIEIDTILGPNESILITYDEDTPPAVTGPGGTSLYNKLTTGSTFFKVKPGDNSFSLTGSSLGTGSYASVAFLPSYPLA